MFRIAGHTFKGQVNLRAGNDARAISVVIPADTEMTTVAELQEARTIEVMDGQEEVVGTYRLINWKRVEHLSNGIQLMWSTISTDEIDALNARIEVLEKENTELRAENEDLSEAVVELAALVANGEK